MCACTMAVQTTTYTRSTMPHYNSSLITLFLVFLLCQSVCAFAPPHPDFTTFEPVGLYRKRLNITYGYQPTHINPEHCRYLSEDECESIDSARRDAQRRVLQEGSNRNRGKAKGLVLLIRFPEDEASGKNLGDVAHFDRVLNGKGKGWEYAPEGSVNEYFWTASLKQMDITFDIIDWDTAPFSMAHIAQGRSGNIGPLALQELVEWKLQKMDEAGFDFAPYDRDEDLYIDYLVAIHSGYPAEQGEIPCHRLWQNRLWSQGFSEPVWGGWYSEFGYEIGGFAIASGIGTRQMCDDPSPLFDMGLATHEIAHMFHMPDTYDTDKDDPALTIGGIANFDVMANPYGWHRNPRIPGHASPFSRMASGWLEPVPITRNGYYACQPSEISGTVYSIKEGYPDGEYLLIENRQSLHWDSDHPSGMLIYHIDTEANYMNTRSWPTKPDGSWPREHFMVAVLPADGNYDLEQGNNLGDEGDYWLKDMVLGPTADVWPNTQSYQGGNLKSTGIKITILTDSAYIMVFKVEGIPNGGSTVVGAGLAPGFVEVDGPEESVPIDTGVGPVHVERPGDDPDTAHHTLAWVLSLLGGVAAMLGVIVFLFL